MAEEITPEAEQSHESAEGAEEGEVEGQKQEQKPAEKVAQSVSEKTSEPVAPKPAKPVKPERVVPEKDSYSLPDGTPKEIADFANSNDMTQDQLDGTLQYFGDILQKSENTKRDNLQKAGKAHMDNWGKDAKYNLGLAKRALQHTDKEGKFAEWLTSTGHGDNPVVLDYLLHMGINLKEGGFLKSSVNQPPGKKTMAQTLYPDMKSKE